MQPGDGPPPAIELAPQQPPPPPPLPPPSPPGLLGLDWPGARERLCVAVREVLRQEQARRGGAGSPWRVGRAVRQAVPWWMALAMALVIGMLMVGGLCSSARTADEHLVPWWITTMAAMASFVVCRWVRVAQLLSEDAEVLRRLQASLARYERALLPQAQAQVHHHHQQQQEGGDAAAASATKASSSEFGGRHIQGCHPVLRGGRWVRLPALLLVEGDVVALAAGDVAPAAVQELADDDENDDEEPHASLPGPIVTVTIVQKGDKVEFRRDKRGALFRKTILSSQSPALLLLCGDLRCFRVLETPVREYVEETLASLSSSSASKDGPPQSLFAQDMAMVRSVWSSAIFTLVFACVVLASLRMIWLDETRPDWAEYIFVEPMCLGLMAGPVSWPLILVVIESLGTARLLVVFEVLERESRRRRMGSSGPQGSDGSGSPHDLDVEQRLGLGASGWQVSRRRFLRYFAATLWARLGPGFGLGGRLVEGLCLRAAGAAAAGASSASCLCNSSSGGVAADPHVVIDMDDPDAARGGGGGGGGGEGDAVEGWRGEGEEEEDVGRKDAATAVMAPLLPVPLARSRVLERLGGVTFATVMDDDLVCNEDLTPEEVFLLSSGKDAGAGAGAGGAATGAAAGGNQQHQHQQQEQRKRQRQGQQEAEAQVTATVLRLMPEKGGAVKFESMTWFKHMAQLKALGFNCLATALRSSPSAFAPPLPPPSPHKRSARSSSITASSSAGAGMAEQPFNQAAASTGGGTVHVADAEAALVGFVRDQARGAVSLGAIGAEIGFCEADLRLFRALSRLHVLSPALVDGEVTQDQHALSLEASRSRGMLRPHMTALVLEDARQRASSGGGGGGGALQMLSQGSPGVAIPRCVDFWDGSVLSKLTAEAKALIAEAHRKWDLDDYVVTVLTYTPVPPALYHRFRLIVPSSFAAPIYLAEGMSQRRLMARLDAIREQASQEQRPSRAGTPASAAESEGTAAGAVSDRLSLSSSGCETPGSSTHGGAATAAALAASLPASLPGTPPASRASAKSPTVVTLLGAQLSMSMSMPDLNRARTAPPASAAHANALGPASESYLGSAATAANDDLITSRSLRSYARVNLSSGGAGGGGGGFDDDQHAAALWGLVQRQVFLGMVASTFLPRAEVPPLVEELMAAGVRFTYFSPRNMRRTKALAEAMGLHMDWNCALSLRDRGNLPDDHRIISAWTGDFTHNARLPHGVAAIREHIEKVDNVPLLVSIFTDATPATTAQMVGIFQEYQESVLVLGHAFRATNAPLFRRADVAVAVEGIPAWPKAADALAAPDARFNADLVGLFSAFRVGLRGSGSGSDQGGGESKTVHDGNAAALLMDLIQEGRRLLLNLYQMAMLAVATLTTAALAMILPRLLLPMPVLTTLSLADILWLLWVVVPLLTLPLLGTPADGRALTRCARKKGEEAVGGPRRRREARLRAMHYLALRCFPTAVACVYVQARALADLLEDLPAVAAACRIGGDQSPTLRGWRVLRCAALLRPDNAQAPRATTEAKDLMFSTLVFCFLVQSASFQHRTASLRRESPLRNRAWLVGCAVLFVVQALYLMLRARARAGGRELLASIDWDVWLVMAVAPWVALLIGEGMAKPLDRRAVERATRFRRLAFDTRLGTHSPK